MRPNRFIAGGRRFTVIDFTEQIMNQGFPKFFGRFLCFAMFLGSLPMIGCGSSSGSKSGEASPIPPSVQESNDNMQNFMKSQSKGAKKR